MSDSWFLLNHLLLSPSPHKAYCKFYSPGCKWSCLCEAVRPGFTVCGLWIGCFWDLLETQGRASCLSSVCLSPLSPDKTNTVDESSSHSFVRGEKSLLKCLSSNCGLMDIKMLIIYATLWESEYKDKPISQQQVTWRKGMKTSRWIKHYWMRF